MASKQHTHVLQTHKWQQICPRCHGRKVYWCTVQIHGTFLCRCIYYTLCQTKKAPLKIRLVYKSAEVRRNPAAAARERKRWKLDPKSSSLSEATDCHYWFHGGLGVHLPEHLDRQKQDCCVKNQGSYKRWQNSRCLPDFSKTDLF